jgi:hypothetical protein
MGKVFGRQSRQHDLNEICWCRRPEAIDLQPLTGDWQRRVELGVQRSGPTTLNTLLSTKVKPHAMSNVVSS